MPNDRRSFEAPSELDPRAARDHMVSGLVATLLDVREPDERALAAIPAPEGVADLFVPMREVAARVDEIRHAAARGAVLVYCHHGLRSMAVARWLAGQGVGPVVNLGGGIDSWSITVDPRIPRYF